MWMEQNKKVGYEQDHWLKENKSFSMCN